MRGHAGWENQRWSQPMPRALLLLYGKSNRLKLECRVIDQNILQRRKAMPSSPLRVCKSCGGSGRRICWMCSGAGGKSVSRTVTETKLVHRTEWHTDFRGHRHRRTVYDHKIVPRIIYERQVCTGCGGSGGTACSACMGKG